MRRRHLFYTCLVTLSGCRIGLPDMPKGDCQTKQGLIVFGVTDCRPVECREEAAYEELGLPRLGPWKVNVRKDLTWKNWQNIEVAGEEYADYHMMVVGNDIAALAHEMVHAVEAPFEDYQHTNWIEMYEEGFKRVNERCKEVK